MLYEVITAISSKSNGAWLAWFSTRETVRSARLAARSPMRSRSGNCAGASAAESRLIEEVLV